MRDLRVFLELARLRHFGKTALSVNLSQPSVSRLIRRLEDELEVELLERGGRSVELTQAGVEFLVHAREILAACSRGVQATREASQVHAARVTLGVSTSATIYDVHDALVRFREACPEVELQLRDVEDGAQHEALAHGHCELLVASTPSLREASCCRLVGHRPLMVVMPAEHRFASLERVTVAQLYSERVVDCIDRDTPLGRVIEANMEACGMSWEDMDLVRANDFLGMMALVAAGFGISAIPASLELACIEGLVVRELVEPRIEVETYVWWREEGLRQRYARRMLDELLDQA